MLFDDFEFLFFTIGIPDLFAFCEFVEWWLRDIEITDIDERTHKSVKECDTQCADIGTIDISIRHDDDTMITSFCEIKRITDTTTDSCDEIFDLFVEKYFVDTSLFCV
jgi:hypothetical protein